MNLSTQANIVRAFRWMLLGYPAALMLVVVVALLLGRVAFGVWPSALIGTVPPESFVVTLACWLVVLTGVCGVFAFGIGALAMVVEATIHPQSRRYNLVVIVLAFCGLGCAFTLLKVDLFGMTSWIAWYLD